MFIIQMKHTFVCFFPCVVQDFEKLPVAEEKPTKRRRRKKSSENEAAASDDAGSGNEDGTESQKKKRSKKSVEPSELADFNVKAGRVLLIGEVVTLSPSGFSP